MAPSGVQSSSRSCVWDLLAFGSWGCYRLWPWVWDPRLWDLTALWSSFGGQGLHVLFSDSTELFIFRQCGLSTFSPCVSFSLSTAFISAQTASSAWLVTDYSGCGCFCQDCLGHLDRSLRRLGYHCRCPLQLSSNPLPWGFHSLVCGLLSVDCCCYSITSGILRSPPLSLWLHSLWLLDGVLASFHSRQEGQQETIQRLLNGELYYPFPNVFVHLEENEEFIINTNSDL